jgi:hypothetical protein
VKKPTDAEIKGRQPRPTYTLEVQGKETYNSITRWNVGVIVNDLILSEEEIQINIRRNRNEKV